MSYPNLKTQQSTSTTFEKGEILSDDGLLWFNDAIQQVSELDNKGNRIANEKFRIIIKKVKS